MHISFPNDSKATEFERAIEIKKHQHHYFFGGTWFPKAIDFSWVEFNSFADFSHCVFTDNSYFRHCTFSLGADFRCATFSRKAEFSYVEFPDLEEVTRMETSFYSATFTDEANFIYAKFNNRIDFSEAKFLKSDSFSNASFKENVSFKKTTFVSSFFTEAAFEKNADYREAIITSINFSRCSFGRLVDFRDTSVSQSMSFEGAAFDGFARFSGKQNERSWSADALNFTSTDIEKTDKVSFRSLTLKPDAFINTDLRKFEFTNIDWRVKNFRFDWSRFWDWKAWNDSAKARKAQYELLSIVYRQLATNAEENNRYVDASNFRFTANEIERIGSHWYGRLTPLSWLYKWSSRFGERWWWAAVVLIGILTAYAIYFHFAFFEICTKGAMTQANCSVRNMTILEAIHQSLMTATLQTVDYRKTILPHQDIFILFEKILAPVQAALLALAIRRKFMR